LRTEGFKTDDNNSNQWMFDDPTGRLVIFAFPDQGSFIVRYHPKTQVRTGDAVLAALINRAESVELRSGDSISLNFPNRRLSRKGKIGTTYEVMEFSLNGGTLLGSSAIIEWAK
jgi:hypothetical protein